MFSLLNAVALALAATHATAATIPMLDIASLVAAAESSQPKASSSPSVRDGATSIEFTQCDAASNVSAITISPCVGGNGTLDSPCEFSFPNNYTITINYTSSIASDRPRSGLSASNTGGDPPSYAYSGQSFGACSYTACPIPADVESVYTYEFRTMTSPFDGLTFNVTDWIDGPSIFCTGFPVKFSA